jgi:beta-galactosidase
LKELIRQNYNRPSIFFWGLYNEIALSPGNLFLVTVLNNLAHLEDGTRLTTGANLNSVPQDVGLSTDVTAWNLYYAWYSGMLSDATSNLINIHTNHPLLGVSEYGAGASIIHHEQNPPASVRVSPWHP